MPTYPVAPRADVVDVLHGHHIADPYRWLEDATSGASREWIAAQETLFRSYADSLPNVDAFRARLSALEAAGMVGPPSTHGDRQFFMRRDPGQEHMVLHVVEADGSRRVLLDPVAIDPSGRTVVDVWQVSPDGAWLTYLISVNGTEESVLHVMDIATGATVDGPIDRCRNSTIAWVPDSSAFYYIRRLPPEAVPAGEAQYHRRIYLHVVGKSADDDVLVFGDGRDKSTHYRVHSERGWLTVSATRGGQPGNDLWVADLTTSPWDAPAFRVVQEGVPARTSLRVGADGVAYLLTAREAPRGRVVVTGLRDPGYGNWRELVPEDPHAVLADVAVLDGALVVSWRGDAASELTLHDRGTGARIGTVDLPGVGTVGGMNAHGDILSFAYTDLTTPLCALRFDRATGRTDVFAEPPGAVELPRFRSASMPARSADGTEFRMIVLTGGDTGGDGEGTDGPRPCILHGYGGFGISIPPSYNPLALAWVAAGGTFVIAQVRGGGERGARWHRAGTRAGKQRVVEDFHAAAQTLIDSGLTSPEQLAIFGGSNGGLMVAAAAVQRPELFSAVVSVSPLLDMVRYERTGLGAAWRSEYGSADEPDELAWLLALSPYHRVRPGVAYPAALFSVADGDVRVDPYHARKMCAALQWATVGERPVLLRTDVDAGHARRAVSSSVTMNAEILAFCSYQTGLERKLMSVATRDLPGR
ncbi:prolyl oligopeptidase family serine peptidase [Micromonospora sp. CPCC 206060]|uniref:prolyl oligopeptidase family serine peptidase n=1 Tax=Micromonospora sp. CPCC 206060 TaxID=3122406 RepID=UPI002FF2171B